MTFAAAVQATPRLGSAALKVGLQALEPADRSRVRCDNTNRLCGSINLDSAMKASEPSSPRWDYGICHKRDAELVHWIEVHPAAHISEVEAKLTWLTGWLQTGSNPMGQLKRRYVWICSGSVPFTQRSPQLRRLSERGVQVCGKVYQID